MNLSAQLPRGASPWRPALAVALAVVLQAACDGGGSEPVDLPHFAFEATTPIDPSPGPEVDYDSGDRRPGQPLRYRMHDTGRFLPALAK